MIEFVKQVLGREPYPRGVWGPTSRERWVIGTRVGLAVMALGTALGIGTYAFISSGAGEGFGQGLGNIDNVNKPRTQSNTGGSIKPAEFINPIQSRP